MDFICPTTGLVLLQKDNHFTTSENVVSYPILAKKVPVLTSNPTPFLQQNITTFSTLVKQLSNQIESYKKNDSTLNNFRKSVTDKLIHVLESRIQIYQYFIQELSLICEVDKLAIGARKPGKNYSINYSYPIRDLTERKATDTELKLILATIQDLYKNYIQKVDNTVFLGAATCPLFEAVKAYSTQYFSVDIALSMPLYINAIEQEIIQEIHEINNKNVTHADDIVVTCKANPNVRLDDYNYVIADAKALPFAKESVDVLIANYFTDTLPIWAIIKEAKRVLQKGGYYLHFGPLNYHFNDLRLMYAEEEIKYIFESNGFKFIYENHIGEVHCKSPYQHLTRHVNNWVFLAQKL